MSDNEINIPIPDEEAANLPVRTVAEDDYSGFSEEQLRAIRHRKEAADAVDAGLTPSPISKTHEEWLERLTPSESRKYREQEMLNYDTRSTSGVWAPSDLDNYKKLVDDVHNMTKRLDTLPHDANNRPIVPAQGKMSVASDGKEYPALEVVTALDGKVYHSTEKYTAADGKTYPVVQGIDPVTGLPSKGYWRIKKPLMDTGKGIWADSEKNAQEVRLEGAGSPNFMKVGGSTAPKHDVVVLGRDPSNRMEIKRTVTSKKNVAPAWQPNQNDLRPDGTRKGSGWLGVLPIASPDGNTGVATEYTVGVNIDGKETDIPSLVPTLDDSERKLMLGDIIPNHKSVPDGILQKAVDHAKARLAKGKSPFKDEEDDYMTTGKRKNVAAPVGKAETLKASQVRDVPSTSELDVLREMLVKDWNPGKKRKLNALERKTILEKIKTRERWIRGEYGTI